MKLFWLNKAYVKNGFTLVEILMAVAVGSIVTLGLAIAISSLFRQNSNIENRIEVLDLQQGVITAMTIPDSCKYSLNAFSVATLAAPPFANINIPELAYYNSAGLKLSTLVTSNQPMPGNAALQVGQIQLTNIQRIAAAPVYYKADLVVPITQIAPGPPIRPAKFSNIIINPIAVGANDTLNSCGAAGGGAGGPTIIANTLAAGVWFGTGCAPGWETNPVSNMPGGNIGAGRNCFAYVQSAQQVQRWNGAGCAYDKASGFVRGCSSTNSVECTYVCF